ncbi:maleylpyruvate isomerase family mycothiol-dependent enzyme [Glaciibacter superstes]|uniref:maleylpyruvate isomerase family mycothiol-dependent enzyme n=1 Tax=Glaciibacter superstes TaxID=501023 RepID=UPI0003B684E8|nr:maleylpyruvate isomerase family mycothiol-dependent enzyme [Glaciibacter superstes]
MGARIDKTQDPEILAALLLARRGTAYFQRKLAELRDDQFDGPSLLPGWSRRHVIAHVGYNARALTRLTEWAATGVENPMYPSPDARGEEIEYGATLSPAALRNLSAHAAVHLNVEWRDLEPTSWNAEVRTAQGRIVPASETVWMRTREVWLHAVDLDNGGSVTDFPPELIDRLLTDVLGAWNRRQAAESIPNFVLRADDRADIRSVTGDTDDGIELLGTAAALTRWATGRGSIGVSTVGCSPVPKSPRWL